MLAEHDHKKMKPAVRRAVLAALVPAVALFLWAFWWEPSSLTLQEYDIQAPPELMAWRGKTVAVIADLHAGSLYISEEKIEKIVDLTLSARPDLILLTGDFVIQKALGGRYMPPAVMAGHLKRLNAPLGVYAVLGNHDRWDNADAVTRALEENGITVLEDRAVRLPGTSLWLAGLSDEWTGRRRYREAVRPVPPGDAAVCLTHNPDAFPLSPPACRLMITGHTHGGQVNFPVFGTPVVPSKYGSRYARGIVMENGRLLFVSSGIGTIGLPVRFRVPPEISVLKMR